MRNKLQSPLSLLAAFVAGALILTPFLSRAEPPLQSAGSSGEIAFLPNASNVFVLKHGGRVYLFSVDSQLKDQKVTRKLQLADVKDLR